MVGPVLAGLTGTLLPALGYFPQAGMTSFGLETFRDLVAWPGFSASVRLSLLTGGAAAVLSLGIAVLIVASGQGTRAFRAVTSVLSPLLAMPHAAVAFSLAFLIAPSGLIARVFSPWATGWTRPPDLLILNDPLGLSLIAGLVVKEVPFLLLMMLAALPQTKSNLSVTVARSMGYGRVAGWCKTVFPSVYAQIRLPVYVVLAYSMSVVDAAIILGPTTPPSLSVMVVKWMADPDIALRTRAAAAAVAQLALVLGALGIWRMGEVAIARLGRVWVYSGDRCRWADPMGAVGPALGWTSAAMIVAGLAILAIWSVAGFWGFPSALPDTVTLKGWARHAAVARAAGGTTLFVAVVATALSIALAIGTLQTEAIGGRKGVATWLIYLPLIVPQVAFLPGLQTLFLHLGAGSGAGPVIFAHMVFVLPYVFLSLSDPWRAWDGRIGTVGATMGHRPLAVLWRLRLPMLLRPILTASAVGIAVSVSQYLPTLLIGGGRVTTLTTEALALASGGDRQAIAIFALLQTGAAFLPFAAATLIPTILWRNRKGLAHD